MTWPWKKQQPQIPVSVPVPAAPAPVEIDSALRPKRLADFTGQARVKQGLSIAIAAAIARGEALDHVLLYGPPGLGKTTLSQLVATELQAQFTATSGPVLKKESDLNGVLAGVSARSVLFIDEIHALSSKVEEILYPAMEDFKLDVLIGSGVAARTLTMQLPRFTLVGATTRQGLLNEPLKDRFGLEFRLEPYGEADLTTIVERSAGLLGLEIAPQAAQDIARRARGTPRIANRLLRRCRDKAQVLGLPTLDAATAKLALDAFGVDALGLDRVDQKLMASLLRAGQPMGLNSWAASVEEEPATVADNYEPYLVQLGFVTRTPRGRLATQAAQRYFDAQVQGPTGQAGLFEVA
jgi:holliday junction DNA helicase RuvB